MKNFLFFILIVNSLVFGQEDYFLTPQDKAYLFHTVRKSPILEQNIGRYFVYNGPDIRFSNDEINYDSIELLIINNPEFLNIYSEEIRKSPKGLLAEAANKQAVWELNKLLQAKRSSNLESEGLSTDYENFETILISHLPPVAFKKKGDEHVPYPKLDNVMNPSLAFNDKVAMLEGFGSWSAKERKQVIDAMNAAINEWVRDRAFVIFTKLGGEADTFINVLTAAGDGSSTSGLFEEREKDAKGRWNKGLPKAVGLFPYKTQIAIDGNQKKGREKVIPMRYSILDFYTVGSGRKTNIHLDVWGYNSEKQTTVVIEKNSKSYPLFGSTESRFLSPDSTFKGEDTYYSMINRVKNDIKELEESISGRKGLDDVIESFEEKKENKLLKIEKTEKELNEIRQKRITTDEKLITKSGGKKKKKKQEAFIRYHNELAAINRKIKELEDRREAIIEKIDAKNQQLHEMEMLIGLNWVPFEEEDGLFIFEDSTTFDLYTQEFIFSPSEDPEHFEIRLIAIPYSHTSDQVDEVMLHVNITDAIPNYDAKVQLLLNDVFASNDYQLEKPLFSDKDSISLMEFFEALQDKKMPFEVIVRGGGIGKWNGFKTVIDREAIELNTYPGNTKDEQLKSKQDSTFSRLRTSQVEISLNRSILMEINSFTDPVVSNFESTSPSIQSIVKSYNLSNNDVLSAYRSYEILKTMQQEINILAGKYLPREEAKIVIDRFNKRIQKVAISVGRTSFKLEDFKE